jgi:polar amino acid transport system substrate-binding protein
MGIPSDRIAVLPDPPSAVAAVRSGRIDAYAGTRLTIGDMLSKSAEGSVEQAEPFRGPVIGDRIASGFGAFGVRKEDEALRNALNEGLRVFIGSAEHLALVKPFGFTAADLPGDATAEALCRER